MNLRQKRDISVSPGRSFRSSFPMDAGIIHISIFWCEICDRTDQGRQADRAECISCNADRIMWINHFVWQILLWLCLCIWNLGRWNVCPISMGSEKSKKEAPWVSEETGRETAKMKYIVLLVFNADYALGFTKKFHGTSPWEVFPCCTQVRFQTPVISRMGHLCTYTGRYVP